MIVQRKIILGIATSAALTLQAVAPASAAEIDTLRAQIEAMSKRLDQLEKQAVQAEQKASAAEAKFEMANKSHSDKGILSGNDDVQVSVSGHVNRGVLWADDGQEDNVYHVDNDYSSTRLRVIGKADVSDNLTVGTAMEVQFESNSSADVSQEDETGVGNDNFTQRRLEIFFTNKHYGKLWLGQGWTASEGTSEVDLSGTNVIGYSSTANMAGGTIFRKTDGTLATTKNARSVGDSFANLDGRGRADRLRYDTPSFVGVIFSSSVIAGDAWDAALRYAAKYNGLKVAAAIAYSEPDSSTIDNRINGSVSVLLTEGLNLTLAAGEDDSINSADPSFFYSKLGYRTRLNNAGMTAFSIDYHSSEDIALAGDEGESYGLQAVQKFDAWSTEAYLGWRTYQLDRVTEDLQDVDAVLIGARIKF